MARGGGALLPENIGPVLLDAVLRFLAPKPGEIAVDCTVGWAGHSAELLRRVGPEGRLIGVDFDADNLPHAEERLRAVGLPFRLHHGNFAGLAAVLAEEGLDATDIVLADLGMSSMQVDDAGRGFSYSRDGPLDMRMDRSRGRTAAQVLETMAEEELRRVLTDLGDEPQAKTIAAAIVAAGQQAPLQRTGELAGVIMEATRADQGGGWRLHPAPGKWNLHPAARTFQALRILVNREIQNLEHLLRVPPSCLRAGGRAAVISFHSGEDRLVKAAFKAGRQAGLYTEVASEPVRASEAERQANPRSRSAKLRWAVKV